MNELTMNVLDRQLCCRWVQLDDGLQVLLTGGDRSHIGAVSVAEPDGTVQTLTFPGHRDQDLSEPWAQTLARRLHCRVCVTCGIHYDALSRENLRIVMDAAARLLEVLVQAVST